MSPLSWCPNASAWPYFSSWLNQVKDNFLFTECGTSQSAVRMKQHKALSISITYQSKITSTYYNLYCTYLYMHHFLTMVEWPHFMILLYKESWLTFSWPHNIMLSKLWNPHNFTCHMHFLLTLVKPIS